MSLALIQATLASKPEIGCRGGYLPMHENGSPSQEASMITAYHSTVLDHPVDRVWSLIRDFNNYPAYIDGVTASVIEDNRRGNEVGAVRRFKYGDNWIRQRLSDHSDERRSLTYVGIELFAFPAGRMDDPPSPIRY